MGRPVIVARDVHAGYEASAVLRGVNLDVACGEVVAMTGRSGSGKSTLLYCLAGILRPTNGSIEVAGQSLVGLAETELTAIRRRNFGFVLQFGRLVADLTAKENVSLPMRLNGIGRTEAENAAVDALAEMGISELAHRRAGSLSGGEQQRVAVARALIHSPNVIFADEPTGALDSANGRRVLDLLLASARSRRATVVLVTHDDQVARAADRQIRLADGLVE